MMINKELDQRRAEMMYRFEKSYGKWRPTHEHTVGCPTCRAEAHEPCFDMRTVELQTQYVGKSHSTRLEAARQSVVLTTLQHYQNHAVRTANYTDNTFFDISVLALGLTGESGEVADMIKKVVGHGHDMDKRAIEEELGDVLWYIAVLAQRLNISLHDLALTNVRKLKKRYPNGFTTKDSIKRAV
jgi:NTP pyrophosphatase (non-canonical NTP hydrolase)